MAPHDSRPQLPAGLLRCLSRPFSLPTPPPIPPRCQPHAPTFPVAGAHPPSRPSSALLRPAAAILDLAWRRSLTCPSLDPASVGGDVEEGLKKALEDAMHKDEDDLEGRRTTLRVRLWGSSCSARRHFWVQRQPRAAVCAGAAATEGRHERGYAR